MACADVMVLGVRGSGEESGCGGLIEQVRDGVRDGYGIYPAWG